MRLVRFAIVTFYGVSSVPSGDTRIADVDLKMAQGESKSNKDQVFLFTARADLRACPPKDDADRLLIPADVRERCEFAIDGLANIVSAFFGCSRSVLSPVPCVALECDSSEERSYLDGSRGILTIQKGDSGTRALIPLQPEYLTAVSDRLDGVALLAEAYSGGELGRYRDFIRFFELAFKGTITQLSKKLFQFLEPTPFGYTRAEIDKWVDLRHPTSHADLKKASGIAFGSDIRPYVLRMEQAALDVLFNKATWRDRAKKRRQVWMPDACTTSATGAIVAKQGTKLSLLFRTYDEFGIYPRTIEAQVSKVDESWYMHMNDDGISTFQPNNGIQRTREDAGR